MPWHQPGSWHLDASRAVVVHTTVHPLSLSTPSLRRRRLDSRSRPGDANMLSQPPTTTLKLCSPLPLSGLSPPRSPALASPPQCVLSVQYPQHQSSGAVEKRPSVNRPDSLPRYTQTSLPDQSVVGFALRLGMDCSPVIRTYSLCSQWRLGPSITHSTLLLSGTITEPLPPPTPFWAEPLLVSVNPPALPSWARPSLAQVWTPVHSRLEVGFGASTRATHHGMTRPKRAPSSTFQTRPPTLALM